MTDNNLNPESNQNPNQNNANVNTNVNVNVNTPNSRGAGTVLMLVFFGWFLLLWWWPILASLWVLWLLVAAITNIFQAGFFVKYWYYPWPAWMFGIR